MGILLKLQPAEPAGPAGNDGTVYNLVMSESRVELFGGRQAHAIRGGEARARARVVVVGAGIVGSSIAYHLARRGAEVTIFDKRRPAAGATWDSFAWINASFNKQPRGYFELNRLGALGYQDLEEQLDDLRVERGGSVQWFADDAGGDWLRDQVRSHRAWGYDTRLIDKHELAALEPELDPGPISAAAYSAEEGSVDPVAATEVLLDAAQEAGAVLEYPAEVTGVELTGGRLETIHVAGEQTRRQPADVLVIAAGGETPEVAAMTGARVPLVYSSGMLAHSAPIVHSLSRVALAPTAHIVQRADGTIVTGADFGGGPAGDASAGHGAALLAEAAKYLPALAEAGLDRLSVGRRSKPSGGLPAVGFAPSSPDVYLAVSHSAVTLAPVVGRMAAAEILDGLSFELLADFRPSRFSTD